MQTREGGENLVTFASQTWHTLRLSTGRIETYYYFFKGELTERNRS